MIIVLQVLLVLGLLGALATFLFRQRDDRERQEVLERRVEAYMRTIRREGAHPKVEAMSDMELRDLLLSGARNIRIQAERRWYLLLGGGLMAVFAAIIVATEEGLRGFGIMLLIAGLVLYGINEVLARRMKQPLTQLGIDPERLRVE